MITNLRNYKKALAVTAAVVILAVASVVVLNMTKPYAVYADGTKVEDPYVVKAGDEELFLVEDSKTAERVIETVIKQYTPDGAQINSISVDKELSVDNKSLSRGEKAPDSTYGRGSSQLYTGGEQSGGSVVLGNYQR